MIGIVDFGMGNLRSVYNAVYEQGFDPVFVRDEQQFEDCTHLILPGVGHFKQAMKSIKQLGLDELITEHAVNQHKPLLGICLGMQLLLSESEEGQCEGLNLISGQVIGFDTSSMRVPHVGWNELHLKQAHPVLAETKDRTDCYFVHSYKCQAASAENRLATTDYYGAEFDSIVGKNNIIGMQFHPEKSQLHGLNLIEQFCDWDGLC